jgi:hypothetical protein
LGSSSGSPYKVQGSCLLPKRLRIVDEIQARIPGEGGRVQLSHELLEERAAVLGARGVGKLPLAQLFSSSPRAPTATCLPPPAAPATGPYRAPAGDETLLEL